MRSCVGARVLARSLASRSTRRLAHTKVAVVSPLDNPALKDLPLDVNAEFLIAPDMDTMLSHDGLEEAEALLWIAPGSPDVMRELVGAGHLPKLKWTHGFYAGIDVIADFARNELTAADVPLTNGRGAFSSSLAEYALSSTLHFVKQVPRCMENRREKRWDKFVMVRAAHSHAHEKV